MMAAPSIEKHLLFVPGRYLILQKIPLAFYTGKILTTQYIECLEMEGWMQMRAFVSILCSQKFERVSFVFRKCSL